MSEFVRSIHAAADRLAGQRGGDFSIRLMLKPRGAAAGQFTLGWSSFIRLASRVCACCSALTSLGRHVRSPTVNRSHREPTLDEIVSDSIVRTLMEADGVDPQDPQDRQGSVTAQGVSGNNSQLASQTNVGLDVGADFTPDRTVKLSVS
jgi:hypothetical protein